MIDPLVMIAISCGFCVMLYLFTALQKAKKESLRWDPFGFNNVMRTELVCGKCGFKSVRDFTIGDYVFGETKDKCKCVCKKSKCSGPMIVHGIYFEKPKTKEELKWEQWEEKWR